ncbi:hypothetical protein HOM50_03765 [bacterium]|jgi:ankyrin repeat protein|nr:hypothetical protein [bacterium]MBT5015495.1 hypothetical protein [bacterium]
MNFKFLYLLLFPSLLFSMSREPRNLCHALMLRQVGANRVEDFIHSLIYTKPFTYTDVTSIEDMRKMLLSLSLQSERPSLDQFRVLFYKFARFNSPYDSYLDTAEKFHVDAVLRDNFEDDSPVKLFFDIVQNLGYRDLIFNIADPSKPSFLHVLGVDTENFRLVEYLESIHMPLAVEYVRKGIQVLGLASDTTTLEELNSMDHPPLEARDAGGNTPLLLLLSDPERLGDQGVQEKILWLLDKGALVNVYTNTGLSPIYHAVNHPVVLQMLLDKGALVNVYTNTGLANFGLDGETLLSSCIRSGNQGSLRLLLRARVDTTLPFNERCTTLQLARTADETYKTQMAHAIATNRTLPAPSMLRALQDGKIADVETLLQQGESANKLVCVRSQTNVAPLDIAVEWGHEGLVRYLLNQGAVWPPKLPYKVGFSTSRLTGPVSEGNLGLVRLLVECGEPVNSGPDYFGDTPLKIAKRLKDPAIYNYLSRQPEVQAQGLIDS